MKIIGRDSEIAFIRALLSAGKHVLLEGPVGSGKTSLALHVAEQFHAGQPVIRVDGDGRFTEQKLVGSFDPKLVMEHGFNQKTFLPGPLYLAMQTGSILLINELNRMPEMVQNVLLPALDLQGSIQIPNHGELKAAPGFRVIATQNPREFVGTAPLSEALLDRMEWVAITYLSEDQEFQIAKAAAPNLEPGFLRAAVLLTRLTREFPKVKRGASIRAAISLVQVLEKMSPITEDQFWEVALSVLANRIELQTSKFSAQAYSQSLSEVMSELRVKLAELVKKKALKSKAKIDSRQDTWIYHADSASESDDEESEGSSEGIGEQEDPVGHDRSGAEKLDDWDFAARFRDIQRYGYLQPKEKLEMSERAIGAILDRAHEMLGPIQKPYIYEHWTTDELLTKLQDPAGQFTAELDVEETLSNFSIGEDAKVSTSPIYQVRYPLHHGLVLVLDTSLSMKGEKLAFLAATVAAVSMSVPAESLAILGFDSEIHVIKAFHEGGNVHESVSRVLSIPPGGFTHIELGLRTARSWIEQSLYPQARVILVSDGRYTEGKDPVDVVAGQSFVHTIKVGKDPNGRAVMREIADQANGHYHEVREMRDLPRVLLSAVRTWVR